MEYIYTFRPADSEKKKIIATWKYAANRKCQGTSLIHFCQTSNSVLDLLKAIKISLFFIFPILISDNELSEKLPARDV